MTTEKVTPPGGRKPRLQMASRVRAQLTLAAGVLAAGVLIAGAASADGSASVASRFTDPTDRYPHNVLGNLPGYGGLQVTLRDGTVLRLVLPQQRIFEDIAPRLWDIDGDGTPEIVAVESDQRLGARLTAWTVRHSVDGPPRLMLRAAGDFIGTRFRWLAPAGLADFTGNGRPEIAYVEMPHLARRLVLVALQGDRLVPVARLDGISNHRIGQPFITGALHDCPTGPVLLLPSGDWQRLLRVRYRDGGLRATDIGPLQGTAADAAGAACAG